MREIVLKGKTYGNTQQMVDAVAWATNRRGRVTWKHDANVALVIYSYLDNHNVDLPTPYKGHGERSGRIRHTLNRLIEEGYAEATTGPRGVLLTFKFKEDVNLNGHIPRFRETVEVVPKTQAQTYDDAGSEGRRPVAAPMQMDDLLPPPPKPKRYLQENTDAALDIWAVQNPDEYAKWAETLIERIGARYG